MEKEKNLTEKETEERMNYTNFMIHKFAEAYKINCQKGYLYLEKYGGLDFIRKHWWALHTDNQYYAVRDVFEICKRNGGYMK